MGRTFQLGLDYFILNHQTPAVTFKNNCLDQPKTIFQHVKSRKSILPSSSLKRFQLLVVLYNQSVSFKSLKQVLSAALKSRQRKIKIEEATISLAAAKEISVDWMAFTHSKKNKELKAEGFSQKLFSQ